MLFHSLVGLIIAHLNAWCPVCAGNKKLTINEARELARSKGGKCLSAEYHNSKKKLLWECKNGHRWLASTFSIKTRNSWCPECYKLNFYSITRGIMANYNYEEISAQSLEIEKEITTALEKRLEGKHIILDKVTLDHIMYSPVVTRATDEKLATKQKLEQKEIETQIAEKEAEIQRIEATGQRDAQQIIDQGLTQKYLQFKALEVQDKLSESDNAKFFFIPVGNDGLPVIINADEK